MPSKFRRAISAVKDSTSIGLAKLRAGPSTFIDLEVSVLKATSHEELPIEDRHMSAILLLAGASPESSAALLRILRRRISKTRSWVVALKSVFVALRAINDSSPYFRRSVAAAGATALNLSAFSDSSNRSRPWDFTAFVRTLGLYIDALLRQRPHRRSFINSNAMAPATVLARMEDSLNLLQRVVATRPTGPAKNHQLVKIALYPILKDSFGVYREVAGGLSVLLELFSELSADQRFDSVTAFKRSAKIFDELDMFYVLCKKISIGRDSDYPTVQCVPVDLLETLEKIVKNGKTATAEAVTEPVFNPRRHARTNQEHYQLHRPPTSSSSSNHKIVVPTNNKNDNGISEDATASLVGDLIVFDDDGDDRMTNGSSSENCNEWELALVESACSEVSNRSSSGNKTDNYYTATENSYDYYYNPFIDGSMSTDAEEKSLVAMQQQPLVIMFPEPVTTVNGMSPRKEMMRREMELWKVQQNRNNMLFFT